MPHEGTLTTPRPNAVQRLKNTVQTDVPAPDEIRTLAYQHWIQRGRPYGSPLDDWFRAEQELRAIRGQ
jgi:hypothetical protein